ncbi:capsule biosynthesis protein [Alphaproteobacteria bacterium GH1-50]|uniref:Capsule biosynthesis protein n=1 Tax=Kangsaoukella pontilimi TaxID=2691042 RepID=A0A7C9IIX8_9RHOB|nr:capsule biosynthesis protein [Kangsaoukella pontilimi]MXQ09547.1 capsule biosynthesis protein [Kangsaoukella pontilimi]
MTMKPKAHKFRIRRNPTPADAVRASGPAGTEDGFGDTPFPGSAAAEAEAGHAAAGIAEIRKEGLTGRQLRMARRLAQKHGLNPGSDFDAVRLLRAKGIDPFDRANMLELVHARSKPQVEHQEAGAGTAAPAATPNLPQRVRSEPQLPGTPAAEDPLRLHELERIQRDIVRRRQRNVTFLVARLCVFVILPTLVSWFYFAFIATPSYATRSEFVVQQADSASSAGGGLLGGTAMATSQDSIMVQDFLMSREAMLRLDADHDYRAHFSDPAIDGLQRVPPDASNEDLYAHYQNHITIGYDPTEGVIRMEVSALSPEMSQAFSEALIGYAEERVDSVTERKRDDQMRGARESFDEAEAKMVAAQEKVLTLQEQLGVINAETETSALMGQITTFETQIAERRLQLQQLLDNAQPNQARVAGVEGDIRRLENLVAELRAQLTEAGAQTRSLASMSAELRMAEVDLETRTMMMQEALQQMEAARIEAMRQVRFLSLGVAPIPPDEPTYPKVFENTLIALFIFAGLYLLASITLAVLRDQVSN